MYVHMYEHMYVYITDYSVRKMNCGKRGKKWTS